MKNVFISLLLISTLPQLASAAEYKCAVELNKRKIAEIGKADLVSSHEDRQFLYKKSVRQLLITVYRDSSVPLQLTSITIEDKKSSVKGTASTEHFAFESKSGSYVVWCFEDPWS